MQLSSRSDEELVTLARRGWPAPFAVLLHRHGATVRAAVASRSDPDAAVVRTFTRAMQHLRRVDPAAPLEPWLLALAPGRRGRTAPPANLGPTLDGQQLDALWAQLAPRWPRGRETGRRLPTWIRWSLLTLALMALAVVIPYATVTTGQRGTVPDTAAEPLRAALVQPAEDGTTDADGTDGDGTTDADGTDGTTDDGTTDADGTDDDDGKDDDGTDEDEDGTPGEGGGTTADDATGTPAPGTPAPGEDAP